MSKYSTLTPPTETVEKFEGRTFADWKGSSDFGSVGDSVKELRNRVRDQVQKGTRGRTRITKSSSDLVAQARRIIKAVVGLGGTVKVDAGLVDTTFGGDPSIYILITTPDNRTCKVRIADHYQPSMWKGGFDRDSGLHHRPSQISIVGRDEGKVEEIITKTLPTIRDFVKGTKRSFWTLEKSKSGRNDRWEPGIELVGHKDDDELRFGELSPFDPMNRR